MYNMTKKYKKHIHNSKCKKTKKCNKYNKTKKMRYRMRGG